MGVTTEKFFETQHTPSQVKSAIVSHYWGAWSGIMTHRAGQRMGRLRRYIRRAG